MESVFRYDRIENFLTQALAVFPKKLLKELSLFNMPMPFRIDMTFTYFKPGAENQLLIRPNPGDLKTRKCHLRGKKKAGVGEEGDPHAKACFHKTTISRSGRQTAALGRSGALTLSRASAPLLAYLAPLHSLTFRQGPCGHS